MQGAAKAVKYWTAAEASRRNQWIVSKERIFSRKLNIKGSFSCKRGFSLLNFERGLKKNYG